MPVVLKLAVPPSVVDMSADELNSTSPSTLICARTPAVKLPGVVGMFTPTSPLSTRKFTVMAVGAPHMLVMVSDHSEEPVLVKLPSPEERVPNQPCS